MTKSQILILEDDTVELLENDLLSRRQYLVRITGWNNYYDFRASKEDLQELGNFILSFIERKADD